MHDLPPGFEFGPYIDGVAVYLGGKAVAIASPANNDPAPPWRISINVGLVAGRYQFTANEKAARRYMAAWARKWEGKIRDEHRTVAGPFMHMAKAGPSPETMHPRRRSRRDCGL